MEELKYLVKLEKKLKSSKQINNPKELSFKVWNWLHT